MNNGILVKIAMKHGVDNDSTDAIEAILAIRKQSGLSQKRISVITTEYPTLARWSQSNGIQED